jgi:hypothetical protein
MFFAFVLVLFSSFLAGDSIYNLWLRPKVMVVMTNWEHQQVDFGLFERVQIFLLDHSEYFVGLWVLGLVVLGAKILLQITHMRSMGSNHCDEELTLLAKLLIDRCGIQRHVSVKVIENVSQTFTVGYMKPIIYFPVEVVTGFSAKELEMILIHELIHIKRNDYVLNLIQLCVEVIFFFNPFVWHMSAMVKNERESSCDRKVIYMGYNSIDYAKTLEKSYQLHYALALGFGGRNVLSRIKSLTLFRSPKRYHGRKSSMVLVSLILSLVLVSLGFGTVAKNAVSTTLISGETKVYPHIWVEDNGDIVFHPDEHRAWHIHANGEQDFYKDGVLKNDELEDNFEYREIDKGDVIEIVYVDKLLGREHKGLKTKNIGQWELFLQEVQKEYGPQGQDQKKDTFHNMLQMTPFGDMYYSEKRLPKVAIEKYRKEYPEAMAIFKPRYAEKDREFLRQMIQELQKDGVLGNDNFDSIQVVFRIKDGSRLSLNGERLSKTLSDKYLIYLKEFNHGLLYGWSTYYLK